MATVYKHRGKITMPVMNVFQSNAIRLKPGAIYESINVYKVKDDTTIKNENTIEEKIEEYEYDVESRVLFLPNYSFKTSHKTVVKYDREVEAMTAYSDSFSDKYESFFKINMMAKGE